MLVRALKRQPCMRVARRRGSLDPLNARQGIETTLWSSRAVQGGGVWIH